MNLWCFVQGSDTFIKVTVTIKKDVSDLRDLIFIQRKSLMGNRI
jgi:hypothetical protein